MGFCKPSANRQVGKGRGQTGCLLPNSKTGGRRWSCVRPLAGPRICFAVATATACNPIPAGPVFKTVSAQALTGSEPYSS
jgi:hypothetical protein